LLKDLKELEANKKSLQLAQMGALLHNLGKIASQFFINMIDEKNVSTKNYKYQHILHLIEEDWKTIPENFKNALNESENPIFDKIIESLKQEFNLPFPFNDRRYRPGDMIEYLGQGEIIKEMNFSWNEIPGKDNKKLIDFLKQNYGLDCGEATKIEKINSDNTIKIYIENKNILLSLNNDKTNVILTIEGIKTDEFIVETENEKKKVCSRTKLYEHNIISDIFKDGSRLTHLMNRAHRGASGGEKDKFNSVLKKQTDIESIFKSTPFGWELRLNLNDVDDSKAHIERIIQKHLKYLFSWNEIPGNDSIRLIAFLKQKFSIDWVKTAKIEKIDNGNTIKVSMEKKYLLLKLNNEKTKLNLEIDDGRNDELIAKIETDKLNIYKSLDFKAFSQELHPYLEKNIADSNRPINDITVWDMGRSGMAFFLTQAIEKIVNEKSIDHAELGKIEENNSLFWRVLSFRLDGLNYLEGAPSLADARVRIDLLHKTLDNIRKILEGLPMAIEVYRDENGSFYIYPDLPEEHPITQDLMKYLDSKLVVDGISLPFCLYSEHLVNHPKDEGGKYVGKFITEQINVDIPKVYDIKTYVDSWESEGKELCVACGVHPQGYGPEKITKDTEKFKYFVKKACRRKICCICMDRRKGVSESWATQDINKYTVWIDEVSDIDGRVALIAGQFDMQDWKMVYPESFVNYFQVENKKDNMPPTKDEFKGYEYDDKIKIYKTKQEKLPKYEDEFSIDKDRKIKIKNIERINNGYLFNWKELPGNDSERITDFLKSNYEIDWVTTAKIAKTDNDKTIMITAGKNSCLLNLNNENTELILTINNGKTYKFIVKTENDKINVYYNLYKIILCQPHNLPIGKECELSREKFNVQDDRTLITVDHKAARKVENKYLYEKKYVITRSGHYYDIQKSQSFARIQRVWETTKHFWKDVADFSKIEKDGPRLEIKGVLSPKITADKPGSYHVYNLLLGKVKLSVVWDEKNNRFITAHNLKYLSQPNRLNKDVKAWLETKGERVSIEEPTGYGSENKEWGSIKIGEISEIANSEYIPAINILSEPRTFMALVPASKALDIVNGIKDKYELEMGKVRNRLPLHLGIIFAPQKTPFRVIMDAGRRILKSKTKSYEEWVLKKIESYLFSWDEIPGNDSEKLKDFLKMEFRIDWVNTAKIEKINNDKTIKISNGQEFILLKLNNEKTKLYIEIDDVRTYELIVNIENDMLNIYDKSLLPVALRNDPHFEKFVLLHLERNDKKAIWHVPLMMGDGKTEDRWYPYVFVPCDKNSIKSNDRAFSFEHAKPLEIKDGGKMSKAWFVHVSDLKEEDIIYFTPSTLDYHWMDTSGSRFEIAYEENGQRMEKDHRPYLLDDLVKIQNIWKVLSRHLNSTQILAIHELIEVKQSEWEYSDVFRKFCFNIIANVDWKTYQDKDSKPDKNSTKMYPWEISKQQKMVFLSEYGDYAATGLLSDVIELYMKILKEKPEREREEI
jgi:hypothetical protein